VLKGFRDFISRGNVIELAVAVVIGAAFTNVVTSFTESFLQPLIRVVSGGKAVSGKLPLTNDVSMDWGAFVNAAIGFLLTAAVVYFLIVMPMNKLAERRKRGLEPEPESPSDEVRLLTEIRDALVASRGAPPPPGGAPVRPDPR
jgi:large conductance mechanosensitive channel